MIPGERRILFEQTEEVGVGDDAVLDHLGHAGGELARRQGGQQVGVGEDGRGLVEVADEVLAGGKVDARLATDGAVDHREQGGRELVEIDAALIGSGREAGEVADDAATEREDRAVAGHAVGGEEIPDAREFGGRLGRLAVRGRGEDRHQAREFGGETRLRGGDAGRGDRDALLAGGQTAFGGG